MCLGYFPEREFAKNTEYSDNGQTEMSLLRMAFRRVRKSFRVLLWHTILKLRKTITVDTLQGKFTILTADNFLAKSLFCFDQHEMIWMDEAVSFLREIGKCPPEGTGTFLDIGANNGCTSVGMLRVNKLKRSIAIEPDPDNFRLLEHNVNQNGLKDQVISLHCAVSSVEGELELERSDVNFGDHRIRMALPDGIAETHDESQRSTVRVPARRLDALLQEVPRDFVDDVSFVWIDVQGHEGYAFQGAEEFLKRDIPVVAEFWPYGIRRAGMSEEEFTAIVTRLWSGYWVPRGEGASKKFVRYPISELPALFSEIGYGDNRKINRAYNIIFSR
jgi:FkbM family methyltransferase